MRRTPPTWTATVLSGWCAMDLHGTGDGTIVHGYCRLGSEQCGCGCHRGEKVRRKQAWTPPSAADEDDGGDELSTGLSTGE